MAVYLVYWMCCSNMSKVYTNYKAKKRAENMESAEMFKGDEDMKVLVQLDTSDDIYKEMNAVPLKDLYIRSMKDFEQFRTMFNAISYDQDILNDDKAKYFKQKLRNRINYIEDTIDVHLNLVGGLEKYIESSYMYKLCVLECNEEKIPFKDSKSMRLQDLIQSYYIFDSFEYL